MFRIIPIIAMADWMGLSPKATKVFGYNALDVLKNLLSFVVRSRFMPGGKAGQNLGSAAVAALTGVMVMSLSGAGDKIFATSRPPSKHVPKESLVEDNTKKHVPSLVDKVVTLDGRLGVRGSGHGITASLLTIAFCAVNIVSGMPVMNGKDADGKVILPNVKTGARLAWLGAGIGSLLSANETLDRVYHKSVSKTPEDFAAEAADAAHHAKPAAQA